MTPPITPTTMPTMHTRCLPNLLHSGITKRMAAVMGRAPMMLRSDCDAPHASAVPK